MEMWLYAATCMLWLESQYKYWAFNVIETYRVHNIGNLQ